MKIGAIYGLLKPWRSNVIDFTQVLVSARIEAHQDANYDNIQMYHIIKAEMTWISLCVSSTSVKKTLTRLFQDSWILSWCRIFLQIMCINSHQHVNETQKFVTFLSRNRWMKKRTISLWDSIDVPSSCIQQWDWFLAQWFKKKIGWFDEVRVLMSCHCFSHYSVVLVCVHLTSILWTILILPLELYSRQSSHFSSLIFFL